MDPSYEPERMESRQVYGMTLRQVRNDANIQASLFTNVVSKNKNVSRSISHGIHPMHSYQNQRFEIYLLRPLRSSILNPIQCVMQRMAWLLD